MPSSRRCCACMGTPEAAVGEADLALRCSSLSTGSATMAEAIRLLGMMGIGDYRAARIRAEADSRR